MTGFQTKKLVARIMPHAQDKSPKSFSIVDEATVDDAQWYTVRVYKTSCTNWVRTNNKSLWYEHPSTSRYGGLFDMHEKLFTLLSLKWS